MRRDDDLEPDDPDRRLDRGDEHDRDGRDRREPPAPPRSGITLRQVVIALLAIVLIAFAIANFRRVRVSFLLFTTDARLVTVIVVAAALGFVIGYFVGRPSREQRKWLRTREAEREERR
jgi:uncharacterized integral membrane protein